jgi:hypothetical protein
MIWRFDNTMTSVRNLHPSSIGMLVQTMFAKTTKAVTATEMARISCCHGVGIVHCLHPSTLMGLPMSSALTLPRRPDMTCSLSKPVVIASWAPWLMWPRRNGSSMMPNAAQFHVLLEWPIDASRWSTKCTRLVRLRRWSFRRFGHCFNMQKLKYAYPERVG